MIINKVFIVSIKKPSPKTGKIYICSDGIERDLSQILAFAKLTNKNTFVTRAERYGLHSPKVLHTGRLSNEVLYAYGANRFIRMEAIEGRSWEAKRCRRDGQNCQNYAECQSRRVGISDVKWIAPANTDSCYVNPRDRTAAVFKDTVIEKLEKIKSAMS